MPKKLIFGEEARAAMKRGIDTLTDTVAITLGPKGRNVVLEPLGQAANHQRQAPLLFDV